MPLYNPITWCEVPSHAVVGSLPSRDVSVALSGRRGHGEVGRRRWGRLCRRAGHWGGAGGRRGGDIAEAVQGQTGLRMKKFKG